MVGALAAQEDRAAILEARLPASDRLAGQSDWNMVMRNNRSRSLNSLGPSSKYLLQHYHDKPKEESYMPPSTVKVELARHEKKPEVTTIDQSYLNE